MTQGGHLVDLIPGSKGQSDLRSQELRQRAEETFKASRCRLLRTSTLPGKIDFDCFGDLAPRTDERPQIMLRLVRRLVPFKDHYVAATPAPAEVRSVITIGKGSGL